MLPDSAALEGFEVVDAKKCREVHVRNRWLQKSADLLERRACETTFHASFLISVSQPAAASQQQPASCSQPASPASQPSQPANVASGHRSLRPPAIRHRCLQTLNKGHPIGCHRLAQPATGCHRPPQAAKPSGTHSTRGAAKHAINPSNIDDMANGRLWDDHFRHLGHPPKFYRVQDASSGNNSPFWYYFRFNLMKDHSKITKCHVVSKK